MIMLVCCLPTDPILCATQLFFCLPKKREEKLPDRTGINVRILALTLPRVSLLAVSVQKFISL